MKTKLKGYHIRMPHELWHFFRKYCATYEKSMTTEVVLCLEKHRKILENKINKKTIAQDKIS